jgi:hypothetical protein
MGKISLDDLIVTLKLIPDSNIDEIYLEMGNLKLR